MSDDLFGFLDANVPRLLTPPAGYEGVHREGNSWARQGDRLSNTSWITPAQWNHLIAQFRALATIEGVDLSDVAQSSPLLLREALLRAIAAILSGEDIGSFGLMEKSVFDPQAIGADVFDRANHMGEQAIATISGLTDALDSKVGVAGSQEIVGYKRFRSSGSIATIAGGGANLEVFANPSADNAAFMGFHRHNAHAVYVGLDTDNKFKLGGWSLGDNAYEFWHAGNFNPGSYATKQYVDANAGGVGVGQTWQDVSGSRAINTAYQNTTGKPIQLSISAVISTDLDFQVSANGSAWLNAQRLNNFGVNHIAHVIPNGWYYRLNAASGLTITYWLELR